MGLVPEGCNYSIPDIDSLLRTMVIPLTPIFEIISQENLEPENVFFKYRRKSNKRLPGESEQNYLEKISRYNNHEFVISWNNNNSVVKIEILSFTEFIDSSVNFLLGQ